MARKKPYKYRNLSKIDQLKAELNDATRSTVNKVVKAVHSEGKTHKYGKKLQGFVNSGSSMGGSSSLDDVLGINSEPSRGKRGKACGHCIACEIGGSCLNPRY